MQPTISNPTEISRNAILLSKAIILAFILLDIKKSFIPFKEFVNALFDFYIWLIFKHAGKIIQLRPCSSYITRLHWLDIQ